MMIDTRPRYRVKEKIIAKGYENEITIPYKGKSLEKIFDKGSIVVGQTKNIGGQNIFSVFPDFEIFGLGLCLCLWLLLLLLPVLVQKIIAPLYIVSSLFPHETPELVLGQYKQNKDVQ